MANFLDVFKVAIIVMLFYSFSITILAYAMPAGTQDYVTAFSDLSEDISFNETASTIEESMQRQVNLPIIELGAIIFYSGNILIDLLLNFVFAIPQMIGLLVKGIFMLVGVDSFMFAYIEAFSAAAVISWYLISLIELLTRMRSGTIE